MKLSLLQFCLALLFTGLSYAHTSNAQEVLDREVSLQLKEQNLENALSKIEETANVKFIFSSKLIKSSRFVSLNVKQQKLSAVLETLLKPLNISFKVSGNKIILNRLAEASIISPNVIESPVTGKVSDSKGEALPGVSVSIKGTKKGTSTEMDGTFKLNADAGDVLVFSFIGFATKEVKVADNQSTINITLEEAFSTLSEVVVTGTRSSGRTKIDTPVPVDVIPLSQVTNNVGQVDINQILTFVAPSFQSSRQAISDGTDHVDPAQLRGLGPDQVLVLVNGKRRHQSALVNVNGTVNRGTVGTDMNAIPATSVEKIEILRDGAAAQYGSDAIAGVINIVLKKQIGLSGNVSTGENITSYDKNYAINFSNGQSKSVNIQDGLTAQIGLNYGIKLGKNGFVNITGEFVSRGATNRTGTYTGQVFPTVAGQTDDQIIASKGLTRNDFDMRIGNSEVKGGGIVVNAALPINENIEAYAFGGWNNKKGNAAGFYRYPNSVPLLNAAAVSATGLANSIVRTNVFSVYPNGFLPEINSDVTDISFAAGIRGKIIKNWNFDLSNVYGKNTFDYGVDNSVNYTQAIGTTNFQRTFDAGGNSFSQNTTNFDLSRKYETVLSGLNLAFGAEFKVDQFGTRAGEEASWKNYNEKAVGVALGSQVFAGFFPKDAGTFSRNSYAFYSDVELDVTKAWVVSGALRLEKYSNFTQTPLNFKFATRYKLTDKIAIRGAISTGFRAPSLQQSYYSKTNTLFVTINGVQTPVESATLPNNSRAAAILGIPTLKPETSTNYSLGATAQLGKLELTVDAYQIAIKDRIILTNNFTANGDANLAAQLTAVGANTANFFTNAIDTRSRGLEAVAAYSTKIGKHGIKLTLAGAFIDNEVIKGSDGKPAIKASETLIKSGQLANYFNREDQSRIEVASPRNKITGTINYKLSKFGAMVRMVHFGEVVYLDPTIITEANFVANAFNNNTRETLDQTFTPKTTTDLTLNYQIHKAANIAIGANNIFDVYQDVHKHSGNMSLGRFVYSRRVQQMGFNGRFVFARVNFSF
ncbi:collagen-binding protein [Emticicia aquatilis]|uniref:Collagen-binding protein n=1 Tax=Emticicia aquatilis TaxID=1537369 RepID=A0A916YIS8_9BACT|nr:TonB-dependent receptor [Emticicia aquatilis]GGD47611.1 collagen-binding protein [Emticicia aquatilis]